MGDAGWSAAAAPAGGARCGPPAPPWKTLGRARTPRFGPGLPVQGPVQAVMGGGPGPGLGRPALAAAAAAPAAAPVRLGPHLLRYLAPLKTGGRFGLIFWIRCIALYCAVSGCLRLVEVPVDAADLSRWKCLAATSLALLDLSIGLLLWLGMRLYAYQVLYKALHLIFLKMACVFVAYGFAMAQQSVTSVRELLWVSGGGPRAGAEGALVFALCMHEAAYAAAYFAVWSYTVTHDPKWSDCGAPCICSHGREAARNRMWP